MCDQPVESFSPPRFINKAAGFTWLHTLEAIYEESVFNFWEINLLLKKQNMKHNMKHSKNDHIMSFSANTARPPWHDVVRRKVTHNLISLECFLYFFRGKKCSQQRLHHITKGNDSESNAVHCLARAKGNVVVFFLIWKIMLFAP